MTSLRAAQPARAAAPTATATALTHVIFARPDLARAERFLADFGLVPVSRTDQVLYLRGTGDAPYCYRVHRERTPRFIGLGLAVATRADLERLAALPGATPIQRAEHPGGGDRIVLHDPAGFVVEVVHGVTHAPALPHRDPIRFNDPRGAQRINRTQRPPHAPPEVVRLGHVVLEVADYQATSAWYTQHFGFVPSDVQVLDDGSPAVTFFRLDLGDTPADHHTLALAQGFMPAFGHAALEVVDPDAVAMGQRVLRERGWRHAWGIGRHILGSQIFDYWSDPWGAKHEHYCDGDMFTADQPTGVHPVSREAMAQWGPPMPSSFTRPRVSVAAIVGLVRSLVRSPDLTFRKLLRLARVFG